VSGSLDMVTGLEGYEAFVIDPDGTRRAGPGFRFARETVPVDRETAGAARH